MTEIDFSIPNKIISHLANQVYDFYLAGGTALSMHYFKHRESHDLDFFTKEFSKERIVQIMSGLQDALSVKAELIAEQTKDQYAKIATYSLNFDDQAQCRIDFIEDFIDLINPTKAIDGINVLSLDDIYLRKIYTVIGHIKSQDSTGKDILAGGRKDPKDFYDLYCLSSIATPLSQFVTKYGGPTVKEGLIRWFNTYDRINMEAGLSHLITDKELDYKAMEGHFTKEIDTLLSAVIEGVSP